MAFTLDPTTDRGKVRLLVFDTDSTSYIFEDTEIDAFLEQNSDSVWLAAADGCRSLVAKYAVTGFILKIPGAIELDKKAIPSYFLKLAVSYEQRSTGSIDSVREYIDSYTIEYDQIGEDISEYVGD